MEKLTFKQEINKSYGKTNFSMAEKWYKGSLEMVARGHRIADMVSQHIDIRKKRVLDIGCGDGGISVAFAERGAETVGIDCNPERCRLAQLRANDHKVDVKFITDNAENMHFGVPLIS